MVAVHERLYDHDYALDQCKYLDAVNVGHVEYMIRVRNTRLPTLAATEQETEAKLIRELQQALFMSCLRTGLSVLR